MVSSALLLVAGIRGATAGLGGAGGTGPAGLGNAGSPGPTGKPF
ncbi:hypothetical protein [Mycobacterium sp.]